VQQGVPEERIEDLLSTDQLLASGTVSTIVEPTLRINRFNPPIETYPQVRPQVYPQTHPQMLMHPELHPQVVRRSTCEKHLSFKLCLAFPVWIQALTEPTSYQEAVKHPYSS